ncbi:MAG: hypothetical protein V7642_687 [Burkholderiales bacterium]|jgi:hypothetical protein
MAASSLLKTSVPNLCGFTQPLTITRLTNDRQVNRDEKIAPRPQNNEKYQNSFSSEL